MTTPDVAPAAEPVVELQEVTKSFKRQVVLDSLSLAIAAGEFLTLLGPSGCGKSTTLNLIAGFLAPDKGRILLRNRLANALPPQARRLGMVFQSWALFPHMTVFENVAYGLKARGIGREEIQGRVSESLRMVRLDAAVDKYPSQLSGGMQQRVALARALVTRPDVLLLDEPLSNLDAALRREMQVELKRIHEQTRVTTVLVTHSQEEALVMSDRVAVMRAGRIEQIAPPLEIYRNPRTAFVCTFVGDANLFEGTVEQAGDGHVGVQVGGIRMRAAAGAEPPVTGQRVTLALRPEWVILSPAGTAAARPDENAVPAIVTDAIFKGNHFTYYLRAAEQDFFAVNAPSQDGGIFGRGDQVVARFAQASLQILADGRP